MAAPKSRRFGGRNHPLCGRPLGALFIISLVALGLLVRRYYDPVETTRREFGIFVAASATIVASSMAIGGYWYATNNNNKWVGYLIIVPFWFLATLAIQVFCPRRRKPKVWGVPLVPWIPSLTVAVNIFLMGSMDKDSFIRFAIWTGAILVYYFFIGLHASYDAAADLATETSKGVESKLDLDHSGGDPEDGMVHPVQTASPNLSA